MGNYQKKQITTKPTKKNKQTQKKHLTHNKNNDKDTKQKTLKTTNTKQHKTPTKMKTNIKITNKQTTPNKLIQKNKHKKTHHDLEPNPQKTTNINQQRKMTNKQDNNK